MKIRLLMSIAGLDYSLSRGDETERFSDAEALRLIVSGVAVLVSGQSIETAVAQNAGVETAVVNNTVLVNDAPDTNADKPDAEAEKPDAGTRKGKAS